MYLSSRHGFALLGRVCSDLSSFLTLVYEETLITNAAGRAFPARGKI